MDKKTIGIIILLAGVLIATIVILICKPIPPSIMGEHMFPYITSDEKWLESIEQDPTEFGYSGYGILADRRSNIAIKVALKDMKSTDPYLWLNAAMYLGAFEQKESVPYLIKALRHRAWRSNKERVQMLQKMTGQTFAVDFEKWQKWYLGTPDPVNLDWEANLGK